MKVGTCTKYKKKLTVAKYKKTTCRFNVISPHYKCVSFCRFVCGATLSKQSFFTVRVWSISHDKLIGSQTPSDTLPNTLLPIGLYLINDMAWAGITGTNPLYVSISAYLTGKHNVSASASMYFRFCLTVGLDLPLLSVGVWEGVATCWIEQTFETDSAKDSKTSRIGGILIRPGSNFTHQVLFFSIAEDSYI